MHLYVEILVLNFLGPANNSYWRCGLCL